MSAQDFEILSEAFRKVITPDSHVEKICDGLLVTEGPVWFAEGDFFVFSDIRGDKLLRWTEKDGMSVFREPTGHANGNTLDRQGRLVTAGHASRNLYRTEKDGTITLLADTYKGKKLNSPNDVVVKSDDTIWFTDPPYAIQPEEQEQPANYVFRLDPDGSLTPVADDLSRPNGLALSHDEKLLYIAEADHSISQIQAFDVKPDNTLANGRVFATISPGIPDGFRVDTEGRVYTSAADGVHVYTPEGELLGKILCEQSPSRNCTFGGPGKHTLFMTSGTGAFRVVLATTGAQTP